jgi:hypothetical protein
VLPNGNDPACLATHRSICRFARSRPNTSCGCHSCHGLYCSYIRVLLAWKIHGQYPDFMDAQPRKTNRRRRYTAFGYRVSHEIAILFANLPGHGSSNIFAPWFAKGMMKTYFHCSRAFQMVRNSPKTWRLGTASVSLLAAIAVYCFARTQPPELLSSMQNGFPILAAQTWIFGSAPSLFYTLSIGLLIGACASTSRGARLHCLSWMGVALSLELLQLPVLARPLSTWLSANLSESSWETVYPYWTRGTFDYLDLIATLTGGLIAMVLLTRISASSRDVSNR